jgi:hypothetical protein
MSAVYLWMAVLIFDLGRRERAENDRFNGAVSFVAATVFLMLFLREVWS